MKIPLTIIALLGLILISACQPAALAGSGVNWTSTAPGGLTTVVPPVSSPPVSPQSPAPTSTAAAPETTPETTPMPPLQEILPEALPFIELSIQSLVKKLNIPAERIQVLQAEAVTWRDASLGCPKPGIDYIRVETPGYNILLEADGVTYNFHTDLKDRVVQCLSRLPGSIYPTP